MSKIFLVGPITGHDLELVGYLFAAAKQRLQIAFPNAHIFNPLVDLDAEPLRELALASGFDPDLPEDRRVMLFNEIHESTDVYLLLGWEQDTFCQKFHAITEELGIGIHEMEPQSNISAMAAEEQKTPFSVNQDGRFYQ